MLVKSPPPDGPQPPDAYEPGPFDDSASSGLGLRDLLGVLRRHLWLVLLLGVVSVAGTYYLLQREQTQFQASALIRLRDRGAEVAGAVLGGQAQSARSSGNGDPIMSELMVLRGRHVASTVVDREGLRLFDPVLGAPGTLATDVLITLPADSARSLTLTFDATSVTAVSGSQRVTAAYGEPLQLDGIRFTIPARPGVAEAQRYVLPRESAVDWVLATLGARPREGTDAITVSVTAPDPRLAVRLTNAVVEQYQLVNAETARDQVERRRAFLEERLRENDEALINAQLTLGRFRNREQVYSAGEQFAAERAGLTDVETERKQLEAEQRIYRSLLTELGSSPTPSKSSALRTLLATPNIASNPMVSQAYGRMTQLEVTRDSMVNAGRPATHPDVQQLNNLIASAGTRLVDAVRTQVSVLDARIAALGEVRQQSSAEIKRLTPAEAEEVRLVQQVEAMRSVGEQLRSEFQRARLAEAVEVGEVEIVDRAMRALPLPANHMLKLALGLAFGIFLGAAIAFLRENLNTAIHRRSELERTLRVPSLGVIPQFKDAKGRRLVSGGRGAKRPRRLGAGKGVVRSPNGTGQVLPEVITVANAKEAGAEAYRSLRTRLLFARSGVALRSVVVTSASMEEGKTTTAANLAVTLAQQGLRVVLVDCDLRRPRVHALFGMSNAVGLTDLLAQQAPPGDAIRATSIERLWVLSSGTKLPEAQGPSELLGGKRMEALIGWLAGEYDMIILDTPPVLLVPDATVLAARAEGTLLVLRAGQTSRALAQDALQQLTAVGATVLGAVLNDPDAKTAKYEEYGYNHGYYYAHR